MVLAAADRYGVRISDAHGQLSELRTRQTESRTDALGRFGSPSENMLAHDLQCSLACSEKRTQQGFLALMPIPS